MTSFLQDQKDKLRQLHRHENDQTFNLIWQEHLKNISNEVASETARSSQTAIPTSRCISYPGQDLEIHTLSSDRPKLPSEASSFSAPTMRLADSLSSNFSGLSPTFSLEASPTFGQDSFYGNSAWPSLSTGSYEPMTVESAGLTGVMNDRTRPRRFAMGETVNPSQYNEYLQHHAGDADQTQIPALAVHHSPNQEPIRRQRTDPTRLSLSSTSYAMQHTTSAQSDYYSSAPSLSNPGTSGMQSELSQTGSLFEGVNQMHIGSQSSFLPPSNDFQYSEKAGFGSLAYMGGAMDSSLPTVHSYSLPLESPMISQTSEKSAEADVSADYTQEMKRSGSGLSSMSARSIDKLNESIENGNRQPIAPKGSPKSPSDQKKKPNEKRRKISDASKKKKGSNRFKRRERLKCAECPQLHFRGKHELTRHQESKHISSKTMYVCHDGTAEAEAAGDEVPVIPLSRCPNCRKGKKYNVYYNSASHLRRAHFHPHRKSDGKLTDEQKKFHSSHPNMEVLKKYWIKEIESSDETKTSSKNSAAMEDSGDFVEDDDAMDVDADGDSEVDLDDGSEELDESTPADEEEFTQGRTKDGLDPGLVYCSDCPEVCANSIRLRLHRLSAHPNKQQQLCPRPDGADRTGYDSSTSPIEPTAAPTRLPETNMTGSGSVNAASTAALSPDYTLSPSNNNTWNSPAMQFGSDMIDFSAFDQLDSSNTFFNL